MGFSEKPGFFFATDGQWSHPQFVSQSSVGFFFKIRVSGVVSWVVCMTETNILLKPHFKERI